MAKTAKKVNRQSCNCLTTLKEKVLKKLREDNEGKAKILDGDMKAYGFRFGMNGGASFLQTYNDFEYEITPIKKDGTEGRTHKKNISIYHSYCPFCGKEHPN